MRHISKLLILFIIAAFGFLIAAPEGTHAASIVVNSLADNAINGDGLCTLREAITAANRIVFSCDSQETAIMDHNGLLQLKSKGLLPIDLVSSQLSGGAHDEIDRYHRQPSR